MIPTVFEPLRYRAAVACGLAEMEAVSLEIYDFNMKNLRYMSNYLDEDMVRRVKKIALSANPRYLAKHVVFRYAICATLKWCGMIS